VEARRRPRPQTYQVDRDSQLSCRADHTTRYRGFQSFFTTSCAFWGFGEFGLFFVASIKNYISYIENNCGHRVFEGVDWNQR
jgi:hypothetical protein